MTLSFVKAIATDIQAAGGHAYYVGGYVRDSLLGIPSKDIDIEVYGLSSNILFQLLERYGSPKYVGESFGVIKLRLPSGLELDISLPRKEKKNGRGYTGFEVEPDPFMPKREACMRRDFTINAMLKDILSGEIIDFFDGRKHLLETKTLSAVSDRFAEDPLRVLRAMQFAARFNLKMDEKTIDMCSSLLSEFDTISKERLFIEFQKLILKGAPNIRNGFETLIATDWIKAFPAFNQFVTNKGNEFWEKVEKSTESMYMFEDENLERKDEDLIVIFFATLFAKEENIDVKTALEELGAYPDIVKRVTHLAQMFFEFENEDESAVRIFASEIHPANINEWYAIHFNDKENAHLVDYVRAIAKQRGILFKREPPILNGDDLIAFGIPPGKKLGNFLKIAYIEQLNNTFNNRSDAHEWLKNSILE